MKSILDKMEEHIAAIRNLQRNFDFHSKRLEKLMKALDDHQKEMITLENVQILQQGKSPQKTLQQSGGLHEKE